MNLLFFCCVYAKTTPPSNIATKQFLAYLLLRFSSRGRCQGGLLLPLDKGQRWGLWWVCVISLNVIVNVIDNVNCECFKELVGRHNLCICIYALCTCHYSHSFTHYPIHPFSPLRVVAARARRFPVCPQRRRKDPAAVRPTGRQTGFSCFPALLRWCVCFLFARLYI
jgi:hypothetical protein